LPLALCLLPLAPCFAQQPTAASKTPCVSVHKMRRARVRARNPQRNPPNLQMWIHGLRRRP
jgi:hypothetical protein